MVVPSGFSAAEFGLVQKTIQIGQCAFASRLGLITGVALLLMGLGVKRFIHNTTGKIIAGLAIIPFSFSGYRYLNKIALEKELQPQTQTITQIFNRLFQSLEACNTNRNLMIEGYVLKKQCTTKDACFDAFCKALVSYLEVETDKFRNLTGFDQTLLEDSVKLRNVAENIKLYVGKISLLPFTLIARLERVSTYFLSCEIIPSEQQGIWRASFKPFS